MTNANMNTVKAIYEAFGKGDIPAILEYISPEVKWESWKGNTAQSAGVPWLKPRTGKEGVMEFFQVVGGMNFHVFDLHAFMDGGNKIAVELSIDVTLPGGERIQDEEIHLWSFDDTGKVIGLRHYADTHKHIKGAGL